MALYHDQLDDFVNLTLSRFKKKQWVDYSQQYRHYIFADRVIQAKRMKEKGGKDLTWKMKVRNNGTARHTGLFSVDQTNVRDLTASASQGWTKQTVNWSYDVDEDDFQSDGETIVREIELREDGMYRDFFDLMEEALWGAPTSPTQDPRVPSGIPFWFQKYTSATPSFQGGNPSGFTSGAAGVNATTYPRARNWAGKYVDKTRDDLLEKIIEANEKTKFKAPRPFAELTTGSSYDYEYFCPYVVKSGLVKLLESRNDNLGTNLTKYADSVLIGGHPLTTVPYLEENDTSNPFYGICWRYFTYYVKSGRDMVLHPVKEAADQHTVRERHMDHWGNFACLDRRQGGYVLSQ
jgi:hypothetical protein